MTLRSLAKGALSSFPALEVQFRRRIWSKRHFPESEMLFLHNLRPGDIDVAIDVGAALGAYAFILARKARKVIAFEPGEVHGDFLARGIGGTNIELVRAAVGAESGNVPMFTPGNDEHARHSATLSKDNPVAREGPVAVTQVPQVKLDDFLRENLALTERVDLLKVDVEGYEQAVFEGARTILVRDHPLVIVEIESRHNAHYSELFGLLRTMGYVAHIHRNGRFERFDGDNIVPLQTEAELAKRLSPDYWPGSSDYVNNFTFEHPDSRVKVSA